MRFGGHETFTLREGWLHKALRLIKDSKEKIVDEFAADYLGVGKNMAKSIRHWLVAVGLAEKIIVHKRKIKGFKLTEFGQLIWDHDKYFMEPATWWAIHINLVNNPLHAFTWNWFFNNYNMSRFDKESCLNSLQRYITSNNQRQPSIKTLQRDMTCMLRSYARIIPSENRDPEDSTICPLCELGILRHYRESKTYELNLATKKIPSQILGYCLSTGFPELDSLPFLTAAREAGSPGRVLMLSRESLFELASKAKTELNGHINLVRQASEYELKWRKKEPIQWLKEFFKEEEGEVNHAG